MKNIISKIIASIVIIGMSPIVYILSFIFGGIMTIKEGTQLTDILRLIWTED